VASFFRASGIDEAIALANDTASPQLERVDQGRREQRRFADDSSQAWSHQRDDDLVLRPSLRGVKRSGYGRELSPAASASSQHKDVFSD